MGYFVAFILLLISVLSYIKYKTWTAPAVYFSILWAIISFFAALQLYNLNSVDNKTWLVILIGVVSFILGTKIVFGSRRVFNRQSVSQKNDYECNQNDYIPKKVYWTLFIIVGIYMAGQIIQTIWLIQTNFTMYEIRRASFGLMDIKGYKYSRGAFANYLRYFISAIETVLIASGIDRFFKNTKKNKIYIFASVYLVIGAAFIAGGRWILLFFVFELMMCQSIAIQDKAKQKIFNFSNKKHRNIFLITIILVAIIYIFFQISNSRGIEDMGNHFYSYLCGCVPLLDIKIQEIDQAEVYSYFFAGQYGLWGFLLPILRSITGFKFPLFFDITVNKVMTGQQMKDIGSTSFNAFTSAFYYLYADSFYRCVYRYVCGWNYSRESLLSCKNNA